MKTTFQDRKGTSLLKSIEEKFVNYTTPKVPRIINSYILTLLSIPACFLMILSGYLSNININYLWLGSFAIFFQYITDVLDGPVARYRNTSSKHWGYYMDHLMDFVFLCSIILAYYLFFPAKYHIYLLILLTISSILMVHVFLVYGSIQVFKPSFLGIGPTESRLTFILVNTFIIYTSLELFIFILPYILTLLFSILLYIIIIDQNMLLKKDKKVRIITFGTFDLFHEGHLNILKRAAKLGNELYVGISTDKMNKKEKGKIALIKDKQRRLIIDNLKFVHATFWEKSLKNKEKYVKKIKADILVMGSDWEGKFDFLQKKGICKVIYLPRTENISSTLLKDKLSRLSKRSGIKFPKKNPTN